MTRDEVLEALSSLPYRVRWADQSKYLCNASRIVEVLDVPAREQLAVLEAIEGRLPLTFSLGPEPSGDEGQITVMFVKSVYPRS